MKTKRMMWVWVALALAGCSQNDVTDVSPDANPVVGFGISTGVQTRGTEMLLAGLKNAPAANSGATKGGGFGVLGYYTGQTVWNNTGTSTPNFMYNQKVTWGSSWSYNPVKYWPNTENDKISFFAYAPYDDASIDNGVELSAKTKTGAPTLTFTIKPGSGDMVDLVATDATQNSGANNVIDLTQRTANVAFKLNHVLSRANFKAKLDKNVNAAETKVFIKEVRILGTAASAPAAANAQSKFFEKATYKWADGTWDYTTGGAVASLRATDYVLDNGANKVLNLQTPSFGGYNKPSVAVSSTTEVPMFNSGQYLFLIPVNNSTGIGAPTDVRVLLTYDVVTVDASLTSGHSSIETKAVVSLPNGTLKKGSAYNFTFIIGLKEVTVDASVTGWATDDNVSVPSVKAASASVADIKTAIGTLNTTKTSSPNSNYFVIDIAAAATITSSFDLSGATVSNFKVSDCIELNFTAASTVTTSNLKLPAGWAVLTGTSNLSAQTGKVVLIKNS